MAAEAPCLCGPHGRAITACELATESVLKISENPKLAACRNTEALRNLTRRRRPQVKAPLKNGVAVIMRKLDRHVAGHLLSTDSIAADLPRRLLSVLANAYRPTSLAIGSKLDTPPVGAVGLYLTCTLS